MLPLWRDEVRVVLAPGQLTMLCLGWTLTKRGLLPRVKAQRIADCVPSASGVAPWEAALQALDAELPRLCARKAVAKVILSNHFMRYAMIPWSDALSDATEEEAYARHCFRQIYGADAEHWELRLSPQPAGLPQLASAMDKRLLAALRGVFKRHGVALKSVQPHLMAAYNNSRHTLHNRSAWFAMHEQGSLCLALLQQGHISSVRTLRSGSDWRDTLSLALEREAYLVEAKDAIDDVFLWVPELEKPELEKLELPQSTRWQIRTLHPMLSPALAQQYEARFAMAWSC